MSQSTKQKQAKADKVARLTLALSALAVRLAGFATHTLEEALSLSTDIRAHMKEAKLSVKAFVAAIRESNPTTNRQDLLETLAVGRAVSVARSFDIDLAAKAASLTACRIIGKAVAKLEELKRGDDIKRACQLAADGGSVADIREAIKVERKAKPETETPEAVQPDRPTEEEALSQSAAEMADTLARLSSADLVALLKSCAAEKSARAKPAKKAAA